LGIWLVAAALAALVIAALGLRQAAGNERAAPTPTPTVSVAPADGHTREGAVRAATAFLAALDLDTILDDARRRRLITSSASPESRATLQRLYERERDRVRESYRRRPRVARAAMLGYRVDDYSRARATVAIWAATIGGSGDFEPTTGWITTVVKLDWSDSRWAVASVAESQGPSAEWPVAELARAARSFTEYRNAP
jgi:hypothetical protein